MNGIWTRLRITLATVSSYSYSRLTALTASPDNWHFYGTEISTKSSSSQSSVITPVSSPSPSGQSASKAASDHRPSIEALQIDSDDYIQSNGSAAQSDPPAKYCKVVARVSTHVLRMEREFQLCKQIIAQDESNSEYFARPIELIKIPPLRRDDNGLAISIFEAPGPNYLRELVTLGSNAYELDLRGEKRKIKPASEDITLTQFLEFAIGAIKCLEILHHQNRLVHGEIRGDAFHFDEQTGQVKMINFGSGSRSFENGLTSAGWYSLSREAGIEHKLQYISPEQTGRLPAQPDGRTDIYSLGVLFWSILTVNFTSLSVVNRG